MAGRSPNYRDGVFVNLEPASDVQPDRREQWMLARASSAAASRQRPADPIPLVTPDRGLPAADLAVTWYGHSSALIEIDGYRVLADPVWSDRCSPSRAVGPQRLHPPPAELDALPAIDAVIISHDHYDHLDVDTDHAAGPQPAGASSWSRSASARTCAPGTSRRTASSNSTGTRAPSSAS